MSNQPYRQPEGGLIDREQPIRFRFNDREYQGYVGDTLASALLANGVRLIARSFKYHRPRGVYGYGAEEPNALVQVGRDGRTEPNTQATQVPLFEGLEAWSQNCWPTVRFDFGAVSNCFSRFLPAGFYYKTFMWPTRAWPFYERLIRRAAGMGKAATTIDPDTYDHRYAHCDVLVVGGGPAGLAAALTAARASARVILVGAGPRFGGDLLNGSATIDGEPATEWIKAVVAELEQTDDVTLLSSTTAFGYYDQNELRAVEHVRHGPGDGPRQRQWILWARQVVLATGAIERPIVFAGNDAPGVMLASAARAYAIRHAVRAGDRAVVFTNNDSAYAAAVDMARSGIAIEAIVDARQQAGSAVMAAAREADLQCLFGHAVMHAHGRGALKAVTLARIDGQGNITGRGKRIACDLLAVSGGWNPTVHLFSQSQGELAFDERRQTFVPARPVQATLYAGSINGTESLADCLREGFETGAAATGTAGFKPTGASSPEVVQPHTVEFPLLPLWSVQRSTGNHGKCFIDMQNDVTVDDVRLARREGYRSVEHVKRYTTLGMATDQGKTSNVNGLAIIAEMAQRPIPDVGFTTFRAPYTPVTLGTFAGHETGENLRPLRVTPLDPVHERSGARFVNTGLWRRPTCYARTGESDADAIAREAAAVRRSVGIVDVSTLGRIMVCGRDAGELLDRTYINRMSTMKAGRCRYGVMLREDGFVFDDGTITRVSEREFHVTTTTANAAPVLAHMELLRQVRWPELDVYLTSATDQWADIALAGPQARNVLARLTSNEDVSDSVLPFLHWREVRVADLPAQLFRVSYSGELAYEILVPAGYGEMLWDALLEAGEPYDITPYGLEAMNVLRIEKGHCVIGAEIDGRTTPGDLGLARMVRKSGDFIGRRSLDLPAMNDAQRLQLVGLQADNALPCGAQLVVETQRQTPAPTEGHTTSVCYSPSLNRHIALALVANGRARFGEKLYAVAPLSGKQVAATVTEAAMFDPQGERLDA